jgi:hypothetical protein
VWEDDFPTEEDYQNAYKRASSVMKLMGGEIQYEYEEHFLNITTHEAFVIKYRMTYELSKLSILRPMTNKEYLSGSVYITVKEIYNVTESKKITDEYDVPKRFIENFQEDFEMKLSKYFRISVDFEMIYEGIS